MIRLLCMNDYNQMYKLWKKSPGVGLRSLDDSREGIERFLRRNPSTNFISWEDGHIVGVILSGHDGRRGYIYHLCVEESYRRRSIGRKLVEHVIMAMRNEKINKLALVAFHDNSPANNFWNKMGWEIRRDLNYYTISLNDNNL
ncbi:GNAT family N-acetyltransferase [Mobilitalea sibirica]|uniref:GNAT family N-acetyltransferase n=1 Tax=Mobilitalea sibirica TaxID=1462919 RepID=A0A8J7H7M1_9FIRM|nr:GNAT family N-acetyltransferase [Mobilitalea sibirica]MBH1941266.1 GNAT family N-acetyltransferase [Mobilitalea sibirica]